MTLNNSVDLTPSSDTISHASMALMEHLFSLQALPEQTHINELAALNRNLHHSDPLKQLALLRETAERLQLFKNFEPSSWFVQEGGDYLYRPELLRNAPLTKVILLLKETLAYRNWAGLLQVAHPHYLPQLLARLSEFSSSSTN
ncbi:hypothetical protein ACVFI8_12835 [Agarivorans sp. MS3-6]|uniref:hypothetical protein n=1 Tax=Agarivorans sp. TSD2052 TaxID=2937286 RepID=UPI00200D6826|nr:hypothetical protein [Agarivorans sp. TSD2052]UPW18148.1 hypothetical protein M0C34_18275 [Agarivorans sp. TSD2052]